VLLALRALLGWGQRVLLALLVWEQQVLLVLPLPLVLLLQQPSQLGS
jgi:hypothetical protein